MHVFLLCLQDIKSAKKALDNLQFGGYEDLDTLETDSSVSTLDQCTVFPSKVG